MLLNFDTLLISFAKRSLWFFKQKRTEPLSEFPLWHVILKEPKSRHSGFIFVTVLSENSFLILLIEKKIKLNYKRNLFLVFLSWEVCIIKAWVNLIILLISLEYLVLAAVFFTFKRAPSLSLEFKVANVIKVKKKQVLLELHNRSRKIILIC